MAFALNAVFEAAQAGSPVHMSDMAVVPVLPASAAGNRAVAAGSKAAAVAVGTES